MRSRVSAFLSVVALACLTSVAGAQAKQATVTCNDGTTSTATGRGACSSHGGVKKSDTTKAGTKSASTKAATTTTKAPTTTSKSPKTADTTKAKTSTTTKTAMVKCTDGTMSKGGQGACSSHGGIAKPK
jgi:hypothetical protein